MEERKSFTFFRSYYDALRSIDDPQIHKDLLMAICAYSLDGELIPLQGIAAALFSLVKPTLDASAKKAAAGSVGGLSRPSEGTSKSEAPKKQTGSKRQANAKQTGSRPEASKKQTSSEEEEDIGEGYIPPTPLTGSIPQPASGKLKFAEFVYMTQVEYDSLVAKHGKPTTNELISILDNYKGSSGKKYKSDYRAILSWVEDKWRESQTKAKKGTVYASSNPVRPEDFADMDRMIAEMKEHPELYPLPPWEQGGDV